MIKTSFCAKSQFVLGCPFMTALIENYLFFYDHLEASLVSANESIHQEAVHIVPYLTQMSQALITR